MSGRYEDMMTKKPPVLYNHPPMPRAARAAQFAPFAALTGHREQLEESARYVQERPQLSQEAIDDIHLSIALIEKKISGGQPGCEVKCLWFRDDERKQGGLVCTIRGQAAKVDRYAGRLFFESGEWIEVKNILEIETEEWIEVKNVLEIETEEEF